MEDQYDIHLEMAIEALKKLEVFAKETYQDEEVEAIRSLLDGKAESQAAFWSAVVDHIQHFVEGEESCEKSPFTTEALCQWTHFQESIASHYAEYFGQFKEN